MRRTPKRSFAHPAFGSIRLAAKDYENLMEQYVELNRAQRSWYPVPQPAWNRVLGQSLQSLLGSSFYANQVQPQRAQIESRIAELMQ